MKKIFLIFIMSLQVFAYDTYFEADYSSVNDNEAGYKTKYIDITVEAGKEISFDLGGHWDWWIDVAMCHRKGETNYGLCGYPDGKDGLKENQGNSKYQTEENVHYDPNDLDIVFTPGKHRVIIQVLRDDFQTKDRFFLYRVNAIKPVISNHKPTAYRKRPTSQNVTLNVNESITFEVRGTDIDGDIDYAWISSSGQDTETDDCQYDCSEQTADKTYSWDTAGSYTVQGYVEDKNGVSDSVTWNIKVVDPSSNYKFFTKEIKEFSDTQKLKLQIYSNSIFTASLKIIDLLIADSARKNNSYQYFHKYRTDFVDNTINSIEGLSILNKLSKNKKIGLDEGLYIASNTISLLIDGLTEEDSDTNIFLSEASSTMFDLYGCLPIPEIGKKADFKSCGKVILLPADLIKRGLTTNDIIENNKIINSIYIALASVRYTIKFNRTLNDINNLDYDSEISNIINNIELINTSNLVNLFSSDLDDREKTIHYIKEFHKLLFSVKYQELLNTTLKDENKQSYNNKPMKPSILIKSSKSPLKPKISLTNYYDSDNDKLLAVWIDIRKVSDNKYLFDSGWIKETTIEIPLGYLEYNTKYKIRARFKDGAGKLSDVSYKEFVINSNINNAKVKFISPDGKPEIVEFSDVKIGECATKKVTITKTNNQGSVNGNVKILTYDNSYVYSLKGENGFNLSNKGDTKEFEIKFCPSKEKTSTSYIQAYTNKDVEFEPSWKAIILKGSGVENGGGSNGNSNSNNNNVVNDENTTKEDFYITNYSLSQNKFIVGDNILYVNSELCYRGDNPRDAHTTIGYYLSKDNILDKNDILLETDSLGFWRENKLCVNENNRLHLNNIQKGTYYIITALDYNHETKESDENNNIASEKIIVTDDISSGNDFYISNFSVSKEEMKPYEIFDIYLNIAYSGNSISILSPKVKIYLSSDKNIDTSDTFLFRISSAVKLSNSQKTYYYSDKLRIPDNTSIGNYYLIAEVNYDNKYNEKNKENNIKYIPIKIINDLNIDTDNDGISDKKEKALGLDPTKADSDGDGYLDNEEIGNINNPRDTDSDGVIDALDTDSDNDGISDADEKKYDLNPLDLTDANQDIDGDGVSNIDEIKASTNPNDSSDYSMNGTEICGVVNGNITWSKAQSPYLVTCDLKIKNKLNIEAGTKILVQKDVKFNVYGKIKVIGTKEEPVVIKSKIDSQKWGGIHLKTNSKAQGIFKYLHISQATVGLSVECCQGLPDSENAATIDDSIFENLDIAITGYAGDNKIIIRNTIFRNNQYVMDSADKIVYNSLFENNKYGLYNTERISVFDSEFKNNEIALYGGRGQLKGCYIHDNQIGVKAFFEGFETIENNITFNKIGIILGEYDGYTPKIINNNIYNNSDFNIKNPTMYDINASNNWWGTTDKYVIEDKIFDENDNMNLGKVNIDTILTKPFVKNSQILDTDNDGISDKKEKALGLDPTKADSDGDGYLDNEEIGDINNPRDTDSDGVIDALDIDSDNDGISDADEKKYGLNPLDSTDANQDTVNQDSDGDGISDKDEENYGLDPLDNSDAIQDIDGDGINNIDEIRYGLNPLDPSDATLDIDGDGVSNIDEIRAGTDLNDNSDYSKGNQESALHSKTDISKLYVAIFNRASEGSGNEYWRNQGSMEEIANTMLNTDDAKEYFGDYLNNNQAFIEWIYKNTLNKDYYQDPDGIGYWTEKLNRGKSKGSVVVTLIDALYSYKDSTDVLTQQAYNQFINRVKVSNYMAEHIYNVPFDYKISTSFSDGLKVGSTIDDIDIAKILIDDMIDIAK